ncbi:hypothetical protein [Elizabethkingia phage TCUEAP1]|nr:hypothetical protein [Elizabethkingia phage TCUEAP1]
MTERTINTRKVTLLSIGVEFNYRETEERRQAVRMMVAIDDTVASIKYLPNIHELDRVDFFNEADKGLGDFIFESINELLAMCADQEDAGYLFNF